MAAFIIIGLLGGLYGLLYYFNSKTPLPEGAQENLENCSACTIDSCELHPNNSVGVK